MIYLVRHGRTEPNALGLFLGRSDPALDGLGKSQAVAVGLAIGPVDRVVTSPLLRAVQTAEAFSGDLVFDDRWIELDFGNLDGTPVSEVSPVTWEAWRADLDWAPPGGESQRQLGERVRPACEEISAVAEIEDVVVVSHMSPIKAALAWSLGVGDEIVWRCHLATGSVTVIAIGPFGPSLQRFNDISHLR